MERKWYRTIFALIKKIFIGSFTGLLNGSNDKKYVVLSNQKCKIQPTAINLHPNEDSQEFYTIHFRLN